MDVIGVNLLIDKSWDLQNAFDEINAVYYPGGMQSGPQRNRQIETWGQLVGKKRALNELDFLINSYGSVNKCSKSIQMSSTSIKSLRTFFESLPDELEHTSSLIKYEFVEGEKCSIEEDLTHEFKEVKGCNPTKSIQNQVDEYILAFLNSSGGSIFFGICDDGIVKSLNLDSRIKDNINKSINSNISTIEPSIDPTQIDVVFHTVSGAENGFVLEVNVPKSNSKGLFF